MILLIAATPLETVLLRTELPLCKHAEQAMWSGSLVPHLSLGLIHTGVGPASTAVYLTRALAQQPIQAVLMIGCAGAYPHSDLKVGDLALATEEVYGDLGVETEEGFLTLADLDIPGDPPPIERIDLQHRLHLAAAHHLRTVFATQAGHFRCGRFVTVSAGSGSENRSRQLALRTDGLCENMEGAAAAQACALYGVPFLELRGISNPTGTRDPRQWDLKRGVEAAQRGALSLLQHWHHLKETP